MPARVVRTEPAMRIVFMGTPDFAVPALCALVAAGHEVVAAYTQPPRPAGRGKAPRASAVEVAARSMRIAVRSPTSLRDPAVQADLAALSPDIGVVAAYGLILPQAVLDVPVHGFLNIHGSLLPRWRGAAPVQRAILAGDEWTGVGIMAMEAGLDTGAVLSERRVAIGDQTAGSLTERLAREGADLLVDVLADRPAHPPRPQPEAGVTYAAKIDKAEARIDWAEGAVACERQVRAFNPAPGAWFALGGERVKVLAATVEAGAGTPGEVLDERLLIGCGDRSLRPTLLQRAGKGPLELDEVLRGWSVPVGVSLA